MSIPIKPRKSQAHARLKDWKEGFDDPTLNAQEPLTEWAIWHGSSAAVSAYRGELLHQLALRCERRGEIDRAHRLYELSFQVLNGNPLALARTLRDHGMLVVATDEDPQLGLAMIRQALRYHDDDVDNQKSRRQRLITETKLWRAQILLEDDAAAWAKQQLLDLVAGPDFRFCDRDRKVIIDFLIPRSSGTVRRLLLAQQATIYAKRRELRHAITSYIRLIVDVELSVADTALRTIFRRE